MQTNAPKASAVTSRTAIPTFALYGEAVDGTQEVLHIEEVRARSSLYQWEISPHTHRGLYQLLWVVQGAVDVVLDTAQQSLSGPLAIVVPPGVVHGFKFAPGTEGLVMTFGTRFMLEGEFQSTGTDFCELFESACVLPVADEQALGTRMSALLHNLLVEFHAPLSRDSPVVLWLARSIIWLLTQIRPARSGTGINRVLRNRRLFTRFLLQVEQHLLEHWSVAKYAARLGLTTQGLNRLARAVCGQSALEVVHERLTREACRRLTYTAAPVGNLSVELGFEDAAYFSRFFKKHTGMTPVRFRQGKEAPQQP